jgi:hypothetical protein
MTKVDIKFLLVAASLLLGFKVYAQKDYARKVVDTLASPYMAGRGYVDDGCHKAAQFINKEFKNIGLYPFGNDYGQKFHFPVNTYPKKIEVSINGKAERDGDDYILIPITPSIKGTYPVVKFDRSILLDSIKLGAFLKGNYKNTFVLVDDSGAIEAKEKKIWQKMTANPFNAKGIIILCDKLTQETSDTVMDYALLYALRRPDFISAKTISLDIKNKFIKDFTAENLVGYIKGSILPDSFIVFSAHYDHLGKMDDIFFPGANDNASGTAMLLSLAHYYSKKENQLSYSVVFIAFAGEEVDLKGSDYYVKHPLFPLTKIKFLINMDIMGTGDEGITVVNGTIYDKAFHDLQKLNDSLHLLKSIHPRGATANSDHYFFYKNHVPDFFIYTMGGIKAYHDIYDRRETLPLTDFDNVFKLLINFTGDICTHRF